jgi:hypothetical protein
MPQKYWEKKASGSQGQKSTGKKKHPGRGHKKSAGKKGIRVTGTQKYRKKKAFRAPARKNAGFFEEKNAGPPYPKRGKKPCDDFYLCRSSGSRRDGCGIPGPSAGA